MILFNRNKLIIKKFKLSQFNYIVHYFLFEKKKTLITIFLENKFCFSLKIHYLNCVLE